MHLAGAGLAQHPGDCALGVAAHDRVVDDDQSLAGDDLGQRVEFQAQAELPDCLRGLDEGPADVRVLDQTLREREARLLGEPDGRGVPLSGTGMTMSASTGASIASLRPTATRTVDAVAVEEESGRARYTYSNRQFLGSGLANIVERTRVRRWPRTPRARSHARRRHRRCPALRFRWQ